MKEMKTLHTTCVLITSPQIAKPSGHPQEQTLGLESLGHPDSWDTLPLAFPDLAFWTKHSKHIWSLHLNLKSTQRE